MSRIESHQRAIDQAAVLFPYLSIEERMQWWDRLQPVALAELTVHMPTSEQRLAAVIARETT